MIACAKSCVVDSALLNLANDTQRVKKNILRKKWKPSCFNFRILEVYRRIGLQGAWVEVDTGGTQEESLQKALDGLKKIGVL